jgi:hypothetical protein
LIDKWYQNAVFSGHAWFASTKAAQAQFVEDILRKLKQGMQDVNYTWDWRQTLPWPAHAIDCGKKNSDNKIDRFRTVDYAAGIDFSKQEVDLETI